MMTEDPFEGGQNEVAMLSRPNHAPSVMSADALKAVLDRHRTWVETSRVHGARAMLAGVCLQGLSLWRAELSDADLEGADLRGANLDHAVLRGALLRGACLARASLWRADLSAADLASADLRDAKLDHAVLRAAILREAKVDRASFWEARLEGADLRDAVGLVPAQLQPAFQDADTRLPAALSSHTKAMPAERGSEIEDDPVVLDEHRGMMAQRATDIRRHLAEVEAQQMALRERQAELEKFLFAAPAASWEEATAKARYLLLLFGDTSIGRDPRYQRVIADVLEDFRRLSGELAESSAPSNDL